LNEPIEVISQDNISDFDGKLLPVFLEALISHQITQFKSFFGNPSVFKGFINTMKFFHSEISRVGLIQHFENEQLISRAHSSCPFHQAVVIQAEGIKSWEGGEVRDELAEVDIVNVLWVLPGHQELKGTGTGLSFMHKHLLELVEILFGIILIDNRNEEVQDEDEIERYEQKEEDEGRSVLIQRELHDFGIVGGAN